MSKPAATLTATAIAAVLAVAAIGSAAPRLDESPPVATSPPTISGAAVVGGRLSTSPGNWSNAGSVRYLYQWLRCATGNPVSCVVIEPATTDSYVVTADDVGATLRLSVTAENPYGASIAQSGSTSAVAPAPAAPPAAAPSNLSIPTVSGIARQGERLTVSPGNWNGAAPINYTYQWYYCSATGTTCVPIVGYTGTTYTPVIWDVGGRNKVKVTATNARGSASAESALTAVVVSSKITPQSPPPLPPAPTPPTPPTNAAPASTTLPQITGTAREGAVLTASAGAWSGTPPISYAYQWFYCDASGTTCDPIQGYTGQTYTPVADDVGGRDKVRVTATNAAGSAQVFSAMTDVIQAPVATTPPPSAPPPAPTPPASPPSPTPPSPPSYASWSDDFSPQPDSRWSWDMQGPKSFPHQGAFLVDDGQGGKAVRLLSPAAGGNGALSAFYDGSGQWGKQGLRQRGEVEFRLVNQNAFIWIWEWHELANVGINSCAVGVNPDRTLRIQVSGGQSSGHQYTHKDDSQTLDLNRWYKLEWDITWSTTNSGRFKIVLDGRTVIDVQRPTLLVRSDGQPDTVVIGGYSYTPPGSNGAQTVDFRRFALGLV